MPRDREYIRGENQDLFRGGAPRLPDAPDIRDEGVAERIAGEAEKLGFRNVHVRETRNLQGRKCGYAVEMKGKDGKTVYVGSLINWEEQKRKLLRDVGLILG